MPTNPSKIGLVTKTAMDAILANRMLEPIPNAERFDHHDWHQKWDRATCLSAVCPRCDANTRHYYLYANKKAHEVQITVECPLCRHNWLT